MRTALIASLLLSTVIAAAMPTQPSMTGTWVATREKSATADLPPGSVFGERFGVVVTDTQVTLTRPMRGNAASVVSSFPLTGAETPMVSTGRQCFGDSVQSITTTKTSNGFDYVIVSNQAAGASAPSKVGLTFKFSLVGDTLVVETTTQAAGVVKPVATVYRRSTDPLPPAQKGPNVTVARATIADLAWLSGEWAGTVGGNQVEERWLVPAGGAMLGNSRSTRGAAMVEFEFLCVAERHGGLVYTAMPNGSGTTDFLLTKISPEGVTFENPDHDFPKAIAYAKTAEGVTVTVTGAPGQRALTYSFKRR